jgi:hypothetical protein
MNQLLSIDGDKLVIEKLKISETEGNLQHTGSVSISENFTSDGVSTFNSLVKITKNLSVKGIVEADTLIVKKIIREDAAEQLDAFTYTADNARALNGKGITWKEKDSLHQIIFRDEPNRFYSTDSIDLHKSGKFQIGGEDVLAQGRLGNSILHSKLRSVGLLDVLNVAGDVNLADVAFIKNSVSRLGINTDQPKSALGVVDGNVEIVIGSDGENKAVIGTWTNHSLSLVTDNTRRMHFNGNTVEIGSAKSRNSTVKIYGTLEVDSIIADTRIEKTSPVEFTASKNNSYFGTGLAWKGDGVTKSLLLMPNPNRLQSTESFELTTEKEFRIGGKSVLSETNLGDSVKNSQLESLGTLRSLMVEGDTVLGTAMVTRGSYVNFERPINLQGKTQLGFDKFTVGNEKFEVSVNGDAEMSFDSAGSVVIGNRTNTSRAVNLYGKVSINITNPDPEAEFSVDGPIVLSGKKFANLSEIPTSGYWNKGDIIWNSEPQEHNYIGWVCIQSGTPGAWKPFGYIGVR